MIPIKLALGPVFGTAGITVLVALSSFCQSLVVLAVLVSIVTVPLEESFAVNVTMSQSSGTNCIS
jgi:hypothetical protein